MEALINELSDMIYHIAREFTNNQDMINDLYNQGVLGVYDAYNNFDKNSETKFSTYAYMYIYGKMYTYINANRCIKVSKDMISLYKLVSKTKDYLSQVKCREISTKDIAEYLNIEESLVQLSINMMSNTLSIDYEYDESSLSTFISDAETMESSVELSELLDLLNEDEKKVIFYKYFSGYSQSEIAKMMNMSQSSVSRCEKQSIDKMRVRSTI